MEYFRIEIGDQKHYWAGNSIEQITEHLTVHELDKKPPFDRIERVPRDEARAARIFMDITQRELSDIFGDVPMYLGQAIPQTSQTYK